MLPSNYSSIDRLLYHSSPFTILYLFFPITCPYAVYSNLVSDNYFGKYVRDSWLTMTTKIQFYREQDGSFRLMMSAKFPDTGLTKFEKL